LPFSSRSFASSASFASAAAFAFASASAFDFASASAFAKASNSEVEGPEINFEVAPHGSRSTTQEMTDEQRSVTLRVSESFCDLIT
jgi:hypothetical protein